MPNPNISDVGTVVGPVTVVDETGAVIDLSAATQTDFNFRVPGGVVITRAASFVTNGTDGQLTYTTVAGDWGTRPGVVLITVTYSVGGTTFTTSPARVRTAAV